MAKYKPSYHLLLWHGGVDDPVETVWRLVESLKGVGLPIRYAAREPLTLEDRESVRRFVNASYSKKDGQVDYEFGCGADNLLSGPPDQQPVSFGFKAGTREPLLIDSFKLHFPPVGTHIERILSLDKLDWLFREWVRIVRPFWGVIYDTANDRRILGWDQPHVGSHEILEAFPTNLVDDKKVPKLIHWYNYFGSEFVERLGGEDKLLRAPVHHAERIEGGVLWVLQPEPFDDENPEHLARQEGAAAYLELAAIHDQYRKPLRRWPQPPRRFERPEDPPKD